ncbi:hypothetical protein C8R48DRAFT_670653 [Suillus tomentosus]|nr:hypothetical protein C8R48DRAFT_670653 [Suillus tomentosus]
MPSFNVQDSDHGLATTSMLLILSFSFLAGTSQYFNRMQIINLLNTLLILIPDLGCTCPGPLHSCKTLVLGPGTALFPHLLLVFPYFWTTYLHSMASSSSSNPTVDQDFQEVLGCRRRPKNVKRMNALIQAEVEKASDANDADFTQGSESDSESSSSVSHSDGNIKDHKISNAELAMILPMKTVPPCGGS